MYLKLKAYFTSFFIHTLVIVVFLIFRPPLHRAVEIDLTKLEIQKEQNKEIKKEIPKRQEEITHPQKEPPKVERRVKKSVVKPQSETKKQTKGSEIETPSTQKVQTEENLPKEQRENGSERTEVLPSASAEKTPAVGRENQTKSSASEVTVKGQKELEEEFLKGKLEIISGIIKQNIAYPLLARKLGMEGRVVISFLLTKDGHIKDIKVEESSGYKILDDNAVSTLRKVEKLIPKPPVDVRIKIPIIYKLE